MLDFIRFLAIGYEEICWEEHFGISPYEKKPNLERNILFEKSNLERNILFENWVKETFKVEIPKTALEIVKHPATMDDESSEDEFFNWCKSKFRFLE